MEICIKKEDGDVAKEIFIYIACEGGKFYLTNHELDLAEAYCPVCQEFDELVGWYDDELKLKAELERMFSAYKFHTSNSHTELIPAIIFNEFNLLI